MKKPREEPEFSLESILGQQTLPTISLFIPTGCSILDGVIGGGYPGGKLVEIFGEDQEGKSALALHAIREAQNLGGYGVCIDSEAAFNATFAKQLGVNLDPAVFGLVKVENLGGKKDKLHGTLEQVFDLIETLVDNLKTTDKPAVIVWDSVSNTPPKEELEMDIQKDSLQMGVIARKMSFFFRGGVIRKMAGSKIVLLCISQLKDTMSAFGARHSSIGGKAIRFQACQRLQVQAKNVLRDSADKPVGVACNVKVVKNKIAPPFREADFDLYFDGGIDNTGAMIDFLYKKGLLGKTPGWFTYDDNNYRKHDLRELINNDNKILLAFSQATKELL